MYTEADPLYARCQAIFDRASGSEHQNVAKARKQGGVVERQPLDFDRNSHALRVQRGVI